MATLPRIYRLEDGFFWRLFNEPHGPFESFDAALNDYIDTHELPEE